MTCKPTNDRAQFVSDYHEKYDAIVKKHQLDTIAGNALNKISEEAFSKDLKEIESAFARDVKSEVLADGCLSSKELSAIEALLENKNRNLIAYWSPNLTEQLIDLTHYNISQPKNVKQTLSSSLQDPKREKLDQHLSNVATYCLAAAIDLYQQWPKYGTSHTQALQKSIQLFEQAKHWMSKLSPVDPLYIDLDPIMSSLENLIDVAKTEFDSPEIDLSEERNRYMCDLLSNHLLLHNLLIDQIPAGVKIVEEILTQLEKECSQDKWDHLKAGAKISVKLKRASQGAALDVSNLTKDFEKYVNSIVDATSMNESLNRLRLIGEEFAPLWNNLVIPDGHGYPITGVVNTAGLRINSLMLGNFQAGAILLKQLEPHILKLANWLLDDKHFVTSDPKLAGVWKMLRFKYLANACGKFFLYVNNFEMTKRVIQTADSQLPDGNVKKHYYVGTAQAGLGNWEKVRKEFHSFLEKVGAQRERYKIIFKDETDKRPNSHLAQSMEDMDSMTLYSHYMIVVANWHLMRNELPKTKQQELIEEMKESKAAFLANFEALSATDQMEKFNYKSALEDLEKFDPEGALQSVYVFPFQTGFALEHPLFPAYATVQPFLMGKGL